MILPFEHRDTDIHFGKSIAFPLPPWQLWEEAHVVRQLGLQGPTLAAARAAVEAAARAAAWSVMSTEEKTVTIHGHAVVLWRHYLIDMHTKRLIDKFSRIASRATHGFSVSPAREQDALTIAERLYPLLMNLR